jgi:hypothetical protein
VFNEYSSGGFITKEHVGKILNEKDDDKARGPRPAHRRVVAASRARHGHAAGNTAGPAAECAGPIRSVPCQPWAPSHGHPPAAVAKRGACVGADGACRSVCGSGAVRARGCMQSALGGAIVSDTRRMARVVQHVPVMRAVSFGFGPRGLTVRGVQISKIMIEMAASRSADEMGKPVDKVDFNVSVRCNPMQSTTCNG